MASLSTRSDGSREIYISFGKSRKKIQLGKIPKKNAERVLTKVESLLVSKTTGAAIDNEVANWVASLEDGNPLLERLVVLGLVQQRVEAQPEKIKTLRQLVDEFEEQKEPLIKPRSLKKLKQCLAKLTQKFGDDCDITTIKLGDASDFESWSKKKGVSDAHQRTLNRYAKQAFSYAMEHEWVPSNPFRKLKTNSLAAEKLHYVTPEDTQILLAACPSVAWKVLVGLARYAGLRTPSEVFDLTWNDIDWKNRSLSIKAHKTPKRVCPILPELYVILQEARKLRSGEKVVELSPSNIRRRFPSIIKKAGLAAWEDMFQTLRRSCETHLIALGHVNHVVSKWLGHSVEVSKDHYLMVTSADFAKATQVTPTQKAAAPTPISGAESGAASSRDSSKGVARIRKSKNVKPASNEKSPGDFQGFRKFAKPCGSNHKAPRAQPSS